MTIPPEIGRWFLRGSGTCVCLNAIAATETPTPYPFLMRDVDGNFHPYNSKGNTHVPSDDMIKVLPRAKVDVKIKHSKPGDLVLFRNHTLGIVERREEGAFGIRIRSSITGAITSHSSHGWAWGAEAPDFDVIVCFESSGKADKEQKHAANTGSLRAMINRLAEVVKKQGAEERKAEFDRTRAGVIHLLAKMEVDLNED